METLKYIIGGVIVLIAIATGGFFFGGDDGLTKDEVRTIAQAELDLGGLIENEQTVYTFGHQLGSLLVQSEWGIIGDGANQAFVTNNSGRTRYISRASLYTVADAAGTHNASSSYVGYMATSSATTITDDFVTPVNEFLLLAGPLFGTSTTDRIFTSTTTALGDGDMVWKDGESLVIQIQEEFGCTESPSGTTCETATSSARGMDFQWTFDWYRKGDIPLR